ncbi:hypothetical protein [Burkholderia anthinoferrum]|uniref:hypothetical protein n=1 Tax=Burkholderia anthinoferrum TaxID=3090833 RepID=UPI002156677E|nr:hypothetical protein [Burkholderia anthinoferrum]
MTTNMTRADALMDESARKIAHRIYCNLGYCGSDPRCFNGADSVTQQRWICAVKDAAPLFPAATVEQPGPITAQTALAAIKTFEIVGENNDSREPNADDRFILTEFIAHAFGGFRIEPPAAAPTAQHRLHGIARVDLELVEREARALAPIAPAPAPDRAAFSVDDLDFEPDAQHTVADMANIGYALLEQIARLAPGYHWNDSPVEIVSDLINERDETRTSLRPEMAPRYAEWRQLVEQGQWTAGVPDWARDHDGRMNDVTAMRAVIDELAAIVLRSPAQAVAAWMRDDDPSDCISDAKKRSMNEHNGLPGKRAAEKYSIALGMLAPEPAPAAIYQILTEDGAWLDTTREHYKRVKSDPALARVVYAAPQPPAHAAILTREEIGEAWREAGSFGVEKAIRNARAQADARDGLTDALRRAREELAIVEWDNDPPARVTDMLSTIDALLAAHPGQPGPHASAGVIAAARAVIETDRAQTLTTEHVNALDNAIKIHHGELTLRKPRAAASPDDQRDGMRWRALMKNGEPEVLVERTQRRVIQRTQPVAFSSPNLTGPDRFDTPSEMWVKRYVMFAWWARENEHRKFIEAIDAISAGEIQ